MSTEPKIPPAPADPARQEASVLLTHRGDRRREVRHVRVGLIALALTTLTVLNIGIYQGARSRLLDDRWATLALGTDATSERVRAQFQTIERQLRFLVYQPEFAAQARRALDGTLDESERRRLREELDRAAASFSLRYLMLSAADGRVLATTSTGTQALDSAALREHAGRALHGHVRLSADFHRNADGTMLLEIAMPVRGAFASESPPVLFAAMDARQVLIPLVGLQVTGDLTAATYLVTRSSGRIVYLTPPDPRHGDQLPPPATTSDPTARAAIMAATGLEASTEVQTRDGRRAFAITRYLPDLDWGLVGQVDAAEMLVGMRATLTRLLVLDALLGAVALVMWWLWRRNLERRLARQELSMTSRHAARVQAIFDTAFDAILTFGPDGRVLTANRSAEALFGRSSREMERQQLQHLLHWGAAGKSGRGDLPTAGVVIVAEGIRSDGTVFPAEFSCGTAGGDDDLMYTAIVRDISERVESERRIRAFAEGLENTNRRLEEVNAQLQEASRLKSEFLANTSHELRTPLNGIIGFLQLVLDGMCENKDEETDFLKQALQCSRHLLGLINDVLDIAKIEAGKLTLEPERVEVEALFSEVHTVTHVQAQQRGITLRFEYPDDVPIAVRCDFAKTKQVLINLIGNSLKFTPRGYVTVRATPHPSQGHVVFEVADTGIGIPPDQQKVIFDKFSQGDGTTTRKYGGTGLGLAISRSLVELQGGIIGVHSDGPGKGTRMYFSLPTWKDEQEKPTSIDEIALAERIQGPASGALVLVVEDDPAFRRVVATVLQRSGYRTVEANHAEAGWALARRLRPALVVLDYALSCAEGASLRTGWDLAVRMTSDPATRHIPLVFATGFDDELREKLRSTAFSRQPVHLMKPIDPAQLLAQVETLVGSAPGRVARVLMADDDPSVVAFVRKVLPAERFMLEVAANGEEALHVLRTRPERFDLLLLDLMMPEVSGYDVLREMTLTGVGAETPVLVLTNFPEARNSEEQRLLNEGLVLDVVAKTAVHENPMLLAHMVEWHLQVNRDDPPGSAPGEPLKEAA